MPRMRSIINSIMDKLVAGRALDLGPSATLLAKLFELFLRLKVNVKKGLPGPIQLLFFMGHPQSVKKA